MKIINQSVAELHELGRSKHKEYAEAEPFSNIYFDNFLNPELLDKVLAEFPDMTKKADLEFDEPGQVKRATRGEYPFGENTKALVHYLNSQPFLDFLTALTGISTILPDPYFVGGGFHQILPGGYLKIHADFNKHRWSKLDRRLNVLVYLNKDWNEEWGGHFELWDKDMQGCKKKLAPFFNRVAIFSTTDFSFHGHPDPLLCPADRSRKSFALYYYTNGRPEEEINQGLEDHSTLFKVRPGTTDNLEVIRSGPKELVKQIVPPFLWNISKKILKR